MDPPEKDDKAKPRDEDSEKEQISESTMTPPRKDDEAIPKDEGSEKEQTTETKMTPPEKDAEMVTKVKGPEQEQTTESPTTPPKKDDKATPKEEGSEEEQKPPESPTTPPKKDDKATPKEEDSEQEQKSPESTITPEKDDKGTQKDEGSEEEQPSSESPTTPPKKDDKATTKEEGSEEEQKPPESPTTPPKKDDKATPKEEGSEKEQKSPESTTTPPKKDDKATPEEEGSEKEQKSPDSPTTPPKKDDKATLNEEGSEKEHKSPESTTPPKKDDKATPKEEGSEKEQKSPESPTTPPKKDDKATPKEEGSEEEQKPPESTTTPPKKDDKAIPKKEGSEEEQISPESKTTPPEKGAKMIPEFQGPEQEQTSESPTTPPKKDDKAIPKDEGSEKEQTSESKITPEKSDKASPKDKGSEEEQTSESKITPPRKDDKAIPKGERSEEEQTSPESKITPEKSDKASPKDKGSEEEQTSESKITPPRKDDKAIPKEERSEEEQTSSESTTTPPKKDDKAIPKKEGSEEEQISPESKTTPPEKGAKMIPEFQGPEQEQTSESPTTPPKKDDKAILKDEGSEEEQISESKITPPRKDDKAIPKEERSEEEQTSSGLAEERIVTPEKHDKATQKDQGSEEEQIPESTTTPPEKDDEAIPKDEGSEEEQISDYKAHVIAKFDTSVDLHCDGPEMKVLSDAFKPHQKTFRPHTIILHGRPGVGKSALARSIILGWAQGKLYQDMSYVFLFSVREMKWTEKSSLAQLMANEWPHSQAPVTKIMSQPERLLFVIDGLDDMDSALQHDDMTLSRDWKDKQPIYILVYSLLRKALLSQSFLIITTRNTGLENLRSMVVSPLYILVEGLSASRRSQLVLENIPDDHQKIQVFHSVIENHQLFDQSQAPSFCSLVCEALQLQEKLGKRCTLPCQTLTDLYATLVFHQLTSRGPSQRALSKEEQITLVGLCRMALEGVWTMRSVFYDDDLKSYSLKQSEISALFHVNILLQVGHSSEQCYVFFDLSLQDFFAALYYVLEGLGEWNQYFSYITNQRNIMEVKRSSDSHLLEMKRFLFGLMNKDTLKTVEVLFRCPVTPPIKQKLQHCLSLIGQQVNGSSPMDTLDAFYYLFESQDEEFVHMALKSFQEVWLLINQKMDLMVSSYCLQQCQNLKAIRVDISDLFSVDNTPKLCPVALQKTQCKPLIIEWWENFCTVLSTHPNLKTLDLGHSILNEWSMKILCLKLRNSSCSIQNLTFKNSEVVSGLQYLWMLLVSNRNLKYLNLGNTPMKDDDIKLACEALKHPSCSLETLRLDSCELTLTGYELISKLLLSASSLKCLSLARNKVGVKSMTSLGEALSSSTCTLQKLILDGCDLIPVSCHMLTSALSSNRNLTHLCLSNNSLGTEEVQQLCQFLKKPECALRRLILNHCNIIKDAYGFLALILANNRKLTHLSLTMNPVGNSAMKLLCEALKEPTCYLQDLELVDCQLTENCCEDLACMITTTKHLQSLDLGNNALGDKGVITLCKGLKQSSSSLRRLGLAACGLTSKCCEVLSSALSCNPYLNSLNLVRNDFNTSGMLKLCSAFQNPASNLWIIGLWKQQFYAQVRRQLEEVQFIKPHVVIDGDWYSIDEDDRNWWKN
uniref:NLR family, pyrin domain containing 5 n=1 Tax=Rattus norvegicus TaxID=10116 RepID=D3ZDM5_RAT